MSELEETARKVIDDNLYLALGTASPSGVPWVSPVYYTPDRYTDFYWVSSPDALHSRNIAQRPDVSITIYDSHAAVGAAEAVYITATATQVPDGELEAAATLYNDRLPEPERVGLDQLLTMAPLFNLYRATATEHSVLIRGSDPRYGRGADSRMTVKPV